MKKLLSIIVVQLVFSATFAAAVSASQLREKLQEPQTEKPQVSLYIDLAFRTHASSPSAVVIKRAENYLKQGSISYMINYLPRNRLQAIGKSAADNALMLGLIRTPENEDKYHWLLKLTQSRSIVILSFNNRNSTSPSCQVQSDSLTGCKVLCVKGYHACDYLRKNGFTDEQLATVSISSIDSMIRMLTYGRVDAISGMRSYLRHQYLSLGYTDKDFDIRRSFETTPLYLVAFKQINPELLKRLSAIKGINSVP